MCQKHTRLVDLVARLRWAIPVLFSLAGTGYVLFEQVERHGHALWVPHVVLSVFVLGLMGPALAWLALTLALRAALVQVEAQQGLAALNAIGEAASQSLDLEEVLRTALEKMIEFMGLEAGEVRLVENDRLILKTHHGVSPDFVTCERVIPLGHCLCGRCAQIGETLAIDNLAADSSLADRPCSREGFQSTISVPMKAEGQVVGVIHAASRQRGAFSTSDQQLLTAIGDRVAVAIEKARLYEEVHRRSVHLEAASLIGQQMTALLDLDSLLAKIVRLIREKFGYYHVHILLANRKTEEVVLKEASGPGAGLVKERGLRLKIGQEGITGWVAHTGQTMLCNDVSREPRYYAEELVPETRAELAVPLRAGNQIIGVLDVQSDQSDTFEQEDVTVLQILGAQVGIAIENARLFQETKQRYDAMVALHETSLDIISQLNMKELLEALLRRGAHLLNAQVGSLFLYDAPQELIYNVANYNTWRDWTGVHLRPGEGAIGQIILTGEPLIVDDYANWASKAEVFAGIPHTMIMGAPLRWQDQTIGGIVVGNEPQTRSFDEDDLWLLSLFADLATIAIKNAELHTQVKEFSQELERKVEERTQDLLRAKEEIAAKAEQLRLLLAKTIDIQEEERARIARDMHDGVVQLITAARYELQAAKVATESEIAACTQEKLDAAREVLDEMEEEIRHVIYDLTPPTLDAVGLVPALQKYASRFQELSGITSHVQVMGSPCRLSPATEVAVFRLVEEALHNVATHARAGEASVTLDFQSTMLNVTVQDDGQGFDYQRWLESHASDHLGLLSMQERVKTLGGKMEVMSKPGHGTHVMFRLPVKRDGG